jgi:hypothetical protein
MEERILKGQREIKAPGLRIHPRAEATITIRGRH